MFCVVVFFGGAGGGGGSSDFNVFFYFDIHVLHLENRLAKGFIFCFSGR